MAKEIDDNTEMTDEEKKELTRKYEDDILAGLLSAAAYKTDDEEAAEIQIVRNGVTVLKFKIRPLSEEEYLKARKDNTVYRKNKSVGTRVADHIDTGRYRSQLIYDATVDEDREKIWNNKAAWERLSVVTGVDLIDVVLKSGEKNAVLDKLDEISGYQMSLEETAKN